MKKQITISEFRDKLKDGMKIMVGGFMTVGTPEFLIDAVVESNVKDLTIICNDAGFLEKGVGKLLKNGQVKTLYASHIGLNPYAGELMSKNELEVQLIPQGTLAEQIRSGGAGIGGFLTPTGMGTIIEEGKQKIEVDGVEYLLEKAMKADLALIHGSIVDKKGNVYYHATTKNFNPLMATACDTVIVGTTNFVDEIDPNNVMTPHIFIDYIVKEHE